MREFAEIEAFFEASAADPRIGAFHINLFVALVILRSKAGWINPIFVRRYGVIRQARISRRTFNKCMKDLIESGYLKYEPSNNPAVLNSVYFNKL